MRLCLTSLSLREAADILFHHSPTLSSLMFRHSLRIQKKMLTQLILNPSQHLQHQGVSTVGKQREQPIMSRSPFPNSSGCLPCFFAVSTDGWDPGRCLSKAVPFPSPHCQSTALCHLYHSSGPDWKPLRSLQTLRTELTQWRCSLVLKSHKVSFRW